VQSEQIRDSDNKCRNPKLNFGIDMKEGWEIKKLGEVCKLTNGYAFQSKEYTDDGYFVIRIGNVQDGYIELNNPRYIKLSEEKQKKFILSEGDILVSLTGNVGRVGEIKEEHLPAVLNQRVAKISLNSKSLQKAYLFYFLTSEYFITELIKAGRGAAQQNISTTDIENLIIPLPPLPEQQRIVSILDEAFAAIAKAKANAEQNLKNAKELFESYLQEVFDPSTRSGQGKKGDGWEVRTLGELCVFTQGIQRDVKLQSETKGENQVRFLRIVDYTQGNEPPRYIDFPGEKYILNTDDVALVRYGASTGFVCRGLEGALANNLFRVIPKSTGKLTNDFLFIFLRSPLFQNAIKATMNGAAMPAISFSLIEGIPFPLPPLKEQQTIVRQLDALRAETQKLEAIYQKKIDNLEELKKSILQKAFSGELSGGEPV